MKSLIDLLAVVVLCFILMLIFQGCSTTSVMQCDNLVGPEKEYCIKDVKLRQHQMLPLWERVGARR